MAKSGLRVSEARIGILTNTPHFLEPERFNWLDTNFHDVTPIPPSDTLAREALRQGLLGETLKKAYLGDKK